MNGYYYPPVDMTGSGIYDETRPGATVCDTCDEMVHTDLNWRGIQYEFTCPKCGEEGQGGL